MQLAIVLWDGNVGGAEKVTAELAGGLRSIGVDATVVFVRDPAALAPDLARLGVPYVSLGAKRVGEVLWRPRRFARLVEQHGRDGALLPAVGHQAPALRIGGYRGPLVAVEHGFLLLMQSMRPHWRAARRLERRLSAPFVDVEVAVSDFMREGVLRSPHARRVERIRNGIDVARYGAGTAARSGGEVVVGCAGRLVPGKGLGTLLRAWTSVAAAAPHARLWLAGDGPERDRVAALVRDAGATESVELLGAVEDMPSFWSDVGVAVMPSRLPESFGMVALEAMASGRPVVATRSGGVVELVEDGVNGTLVPVGEAAAMADALLGYLQSAELRHAHGAAGRSRCEADFGIERCAEGYARLFAEVGPSQMPLAASQAVREEVHA
jgi:glycosyltransferase involved in cell wall biosynthesis